MPPAIAYTAHSAPRQAGQAARRRPGAGTVLQHHPR
jgi:hypothetical protein